MDEFLAFRHHLTNIVRMMDVARDAAQDSETLDGKLEIVVALRTQLQTRVQAAPALWTALKAQLDAAAIRMGVA